MDTNEITHTVMGACMEVHRFLGPGMLAEVYREALAREMRMREILFDEQKALKVNYKGHDLPTTLVADFVVEDVLILDIRAQEELLPRDKDRLNGFLRISGVENGLLINFNVANLRTGVKRLIVSSEEPNVPWTSGSKPPRRKRRGA